MVIAIVEIMGWIINKMEGGSAYGKSISLTKEVCMGKVPALIRDLERPAGVGESKRFFRCQLGWP